MFNIDDINRDNFNRPHSGLAPYQTRARKAWVAFAPDSFREYAKKLESGIRFELYSELDDDVMKEFVVLCREGVEGDEAMVRAGEAVGANLKCEENNENI